MRNIIQSLEALRFYMERGEIHIYTYVEEKLDS